MVIARGFWPREYAEVSWSQIELSSNSFRLRGTASQLSFSPTLNPEVFRVRKDILDQQVVDIHNHKVIRVNDVHFLSVQPPRLVHVDIGTRGLMRRMGFEKAVDR